MSHLRGANADKGVWRASKGHAEGPTHSIYVSRHSALFARSH